MPEISNDGTISTTTDSNKAVTCLFVMLEINSPIDSETNINNKGNRLELIGINTCKYGIE